MSESKVGSKKRQKIHWEELKFKRLKVENEAVSKCSICNIICKNTSYDLLLAHRYVNIINPSLIYIIVFNF